MASFLAIYSKSKVVETILLNSLLADFSSNGTRKLECKDFNGFHFYTDEKFKQSLFENENGVSFVSGLISIDQSGEKLCSNHVEQLDVILNHNENLNLEKWEGVFAAINYTKSTHTLTYINDKFGISPIFVLENENYIILSNEYQTLANYNAQLDNEAIAEFLTFGVCLGNKTFFKNIQNLAPASIVKSHYEQTNKKIYWEAKTIVTSEKEIDFLAKEMYELFKKINQEYIDAELTQVTLLTAGADSRLIVATLTETQLKRLKFMTSSLTFLDAQEDKDAVGAAAIAQKFNLDHTIEKISFYEKTFCPEYFEKERKMREKVVYGGWHGGELLGGFCMNASPIRKTLSFQEIDKKYKSIFNWRFRFKLQNHPFIAYSDEIKKLNGNQLLFMIHQITRSFFTNIYGGSKGHWVQPFQLVNHGFSPFWDSRFLQLLLQVPLSELENYNFYNKVFAYVNSDFKSIPSNSPLTNRDDSLLLKMNSGIEPKHQFPDVHHEAYLDCIRDRKIWKRHMYTKNMLKKLLASEYDALTRQWLDFEVWRRKYAK